MEALHNRRACAGWGPVTTPQHPSMAVTCQHHCLITNAGLHAGQVGGAV